MNIFELLGHGVKVAVKDTGKGIATAAKDTAKAVATAAPVIESVAPMIPVAGPMVETFAETMARYIHTPTGGLVDRGKLLVSFVHNSTTGEDMNPLESFAITMVLGILQTVVKNPAHKEVMEKQLIGVADMIYSTYGLSVPAPVALPSPEVSH